VKKRSLQGVNEHFELIFNAVLCQPNNFKTASNVKKKQKQWMTQD
jgi:hypothetical protein